MAGEIETVNKFLVHAIGERVGIGTLSPIPLTADDALLLAAWLVAIAAALRPTHVFEDVLAAVQST